MRRVGNSGRQKATPNEITRTLQEAMLAAATSVGELEFDKKTQRYKATGKNGLLGYLKSLSVNHPATFVTLLGRVLLLPITDEVDHNHIDKPHRTVEEIEAELRKRGIPVDLLLPPYEPSKLKLPPSLRVSH
jgi:hypothetical protein